MRFWVGMFGCVALAGCMQTLWEKPGATPAEFTQDSAKCRLVARGLNPGGFLAEGTPQFVAGAAIGSAIGTAAAQTATFNDCMMADGYLPEGPQVQAGLAKLRPIIAQTAICISAIYDLPVAEPIRRHLPLSAVDATPAQLSDPTFVSPDEAAAVGAIYPRLAECQNKTLSQMSASAPALVPILARQYASIAQQLTLLKDRRISFGEFTSEWRAATAKLEGQMLAALQAGG